MLMSVRLSLRTAGLEMVKENRFDAGQSGQQQPLSPPVQGALAAVMERVAPSLHIGRQRNWEALQRRSPSPPPLARLSARAASSARPRTLRAGTHHQSSSPAQHQRPCRQLGRRRTSNADRTGPARRTCYRRPAVAAALFQHKHLMLKFAVFAKLEHELTVTAIVEKDTRSTALRTKER